jgi:L-alanine-DL-glutamate epimerase-like enolase superfamily enzyme
MADYAAGLNDFPILKIKVDADRPVERVTKIRGARADARLIVDANTSWSVEQLYDVSPALAELGVELIEQPCLPRLDGSLDKSRLPVPLCADESCHTTDDLPRLEAGYAAVCIKLDKTGGLTEALALARAAQARGMLLMIGNMLGTALAMAPLSLIGPWCAFVDIDGPLLLAEDRAPGMDARGSIIPPLVPRCWG